MDKKTALITGINGQDGSYLAEFLISKGYRVVGMIRRNSVPESQSIRIDHLQNQITLEYGDLLDTSSLERIFSKYSPDEVYNLGAQSHVRISFDEPIYTSQVNAIGTLNLLETSRHAVRHAKIYQASSSEMFGNNIDSDGFQRETTPMSPVSPYGCAKLYAYHLTKNYRNAYGMFISNGILFNHESPRRGINFVTNKVVKGAVEIKLGHLDHLTLGNLDAARDWGHASDYVKAMWMMLQQEQPNDFVCATGVSHTVQDLCKYVFDKLGLDYRTYVKTDSKYLRPEELARLKGDSRKAKTTLGWKPVYTFETMLDEMIQYWIKIL